MNNERGYIMKRCLASLVLAISVLLGSTAIFAEVDSNQITPREHNEVSLMEEKSNGEGLLSVKEISKKSESVIYIKVYDQEEQLLGGGSGFIISSDGVVVTNFHVIKDAYKLELIAADKTYDNEGVLAFDEERDVAVLKIKGEDNFKFVNLGDSDKIELGEDIVAIGNSIRPLMEDLAGFKIGGPTVSTGVISNFVDEDNNAFFQITAPISGGNSGGALFNMKGEVIGIPSAGFSNVIAQNVNLAIPINDVKKILDKMDTTHLISLKGVREELYLKCTKTLVEKYSRDYYGWNSFRIDNIKITENEKNYKELKILVEIKKDNYRKLIRNISNGVEMGKFYTESVLNDIGEDIIDNFPNSELKIKMFLKDSLETKPETFPKDAISYDSDKDEWEVNLLILQGTENNAYGGWPFYSYGKDYFRGFDFKWSGLYLDLDFLS